MSAMAWRPLFVVMHRWAGLLIALFLLVSGLTGAVISWDHELDEWLNPHLTGATTDGEPMSPLLLANRIEARHPQVAVTFAPLATQAGHSLAFGVAPRVDAATGELFRPGFNQVFVDPVSGEELGAREWGAVWPVTKETFVSFLYVLHYSLHLPAFQGTDRWGIWLMGVIALVWTADCFTGVLLTVPSRRRRRTAAGGPAATGWWQRWKPAWKVRWGSGAWKVNFDLHRAGSLWTWGLLFTVAFTAFSLNLYREVFFPVMSRLSEVTPSPFDLREPRAMNDPVEPVLDRAAALDLARSEAARRGWPEPAGALFHEPLFGIYGVQFFHPEDGHGAGGVGHRTLYLDSGDGRILGEREPWRGTVADIFLQAQFPLHSGRILGLPGRILISLTGLVVVVLSVTGVVVWWRKRRARRMASGRAAVTAHAAVAGPVDASRARRTLSR
jgi:uncharacterized iron-regulated membrane protein